MTSHLFLRDPGGVHVGIPFLASDHAVAVEAPAEVHRELDVGIGHEGGGIALYVQYLGQCSLPRRDRRPSEVGRASGPGPHPGVDGTPGRYGGHGFRVGAGEEQALPGEGIEGRGLYPVVAVGAHVVFSQAVEDNQDDVHSGSPARKVLLGQVCQVFGEAGAPGCAEQGHPGRTGARGSQEVLARQRPLRFVSHSKPAPTAVPRIRTLPADVSSTIIHPTSRKERSQKLMSRRSLTLAFSGFSAVPRPPTIIAFRSVPDSVRPIPPAQGPSSAAWQLSLEHPRSTSSRSRRRRTSSGCAAPYRLS